MLPIAQFIGREAARYPAGGARPPRDHLSSSPRPGLRVRLRSFAASLRPRRGGRSERRRERVPTRA